MPFLDILLISVGLAMDATAASATRGMAVPRIRLRHMLLVAGFFGGFQALMPLLGWMVGAKVGPLVEAWDHWLAFVLLAGIGGKMLWEARPGAPEEPHEEREANAFDLRVLLLLAVATSIDALAVGITLPILGAPLALSLATIGITTAILSVVGLWLGRRFGDTLGKGLDVIGGFVLVALGVKILIEHLAA